MSLILTAPVTVSPTRATMQVGDTLWVEAACSDSLRDFETGRRFRVQPQDLPLASYFAIHKLFGNGQPTTANASAFRVVEKIGRAGTGGALTGQFFPIYDGHTYRFRFGLIPTQPGINAISLLLMPAEGESGLEKNIPALAAQLPPDPEGREQRAGIYDLDYLINEGKANNYDLFRKQTTIDPETSGLPATSLVYSRQSTFTVEVK
ncbi:hypothetical protein [Hymenobacter cheonanensis]|uniref:hypothetical protein n=1 Tax=Hymenobacter sp. CA2-7 TaxID=3063993 RepID=UPI00271223CC|nr:hypothetical protein [Hymenobacter sp. CA2-7]MDO7887484.1 hypothetical protein [Hymenobacter sp. CA2-7]